MLKFISFKSIQAPVLLLLLGLTWGLGYGLARFAMTHGVHPLGYAFWQSLGPALLLATVTIFQDGLGGLKCSSWSFFITCSLFGILIPNINVYFLSSHLPSGILAVLVNTVPIWIYPLALLTRQERFNTTRLFALMLGLIGIFLIVTPKDTPRLTSDMFTALISPISFACCSIYIGNKQPPVLNSLQAATGMLLMATMMLAPIVWHQHAFYALSEPWSLTKSVIVIEMILSSLGYVLFFRLITMAGPVFYSLTGGVVAITGLLWGYLVFGEIPHLQQSFANLAIVAAIFLLSWQQYRQPKQKHYAQPTHPTIQRAN